MLSEKKKALRKELKARLLRLKEDYLQEADTAIREKLWRLREYREARSIYCYCSVGREVDTRPILSRALEDGKTVALPVIEDGRMRPRRLGPEGLLVPGFYGIPTPPETEPWIEEEEIDLILVPGLAYDEAGYRLGYGGGYYDRLLSTAPGLAVGLCREAMILREIPRESHDMAVEVLITEQTAAYLR